jgi:hypothetical protein
MKKRLLLAGIVSTISITANAQFWDITEPVRLPGTVNTITGEESIPVFSKDSSILYFVRTFDPSAVGGENDQDIWFSKREKDGSYTDCQRLTDVNNKYNNAVLGLGKGGNTMYVLNAYEGKKDLVKGLASSQQKGNGWEKPLEVAIPTLDIEGDFYGFHVNETENVIIISYKGPGSLGEEDLYVSTKKGAEWSAPVHMGSTLNTSGFEISPFLSKSQDTLFFSSNGHGGQGDADIFYSVKQGGSWTNWSKPVNLGKKINSSKFDAYFILSANHLYWSSNRDGERSDIYMATILAPPPVSIACKGTDATVYGGKDGKTDATVNGGVGPFSYKWSTGATSEDLTGLGKGDFTVTVTDNIGQTANATCSVGEPKPLIVQNLELKHFFEYNGDKLTVEEGKLKDFVSKIEGQLTTGGREKITINIWSSASYVPTKTFKTNDKLARSRAERIQSELNKYFADKGLSKKVTVKVVSAIVQGPKYEGDFENTAKYHDFQFIELKTE